MTTAADVRHRQPPAPLAVPGEKLSKIKDRLIRLYPHFIPGKKVNVSPRLWEVREYAAYAADYWKEQLEIANLLIRQEMGDAETAMVGGLPVLTRLQGDVKSHFVEAGTRDYLRAASK